MKILLCSVPDGPLAGTLDRNHPDVTPQIPIGILRLVDWMDGNGYSSEIYDINNLRPPDKELIETFKRINPDVVGLSATLSHCYPNVKRISNLLRQLFPKVWIVVGGHITASANVILKKTCADFCVIGDGEIPWLKLLNYFKSHKNHEFNYSILNDIKGLAFKDSNNKLQVTGNAEQIPQSELKYTDWERLKKTLGDKAWLVDELFNKVRDNPVVKNTKFYEKNINKKVASIDLSKGCVARCTFCQRATKGYRIYGLDTLDAYVKNLKEKFDVAGIAISDENFGSNKIQSYEFARIMKKNDLFWTSNATRTTTFSLEDLKFLKEHNLVNMKFGIESGSQKILDIMEKKANTEDIYNSIANCAKLGIRSEPDALMLGMPGETRETVIESSQFIASLRHVMGLDWNIGPTFWAMAVPGTPLYEYSQQIGVIGNSLDNEELYLIRLAEEKTSFLNYINKTNSNIKEVYYWNYLFHYSGKKAYVNLIFKNNKKIKDKISETYKKCIKGELKHYFANLLNIYRKKGFYHPKNHKANLLQKIKWVTLLTADLSLSILSLILPKIILFSIVKAYSDLRFLVMERKYKRKSGKQKYNLFVERNEEVHDNFKITEKRISDTNRQKDRSLRNIVFMNRAMLKPPVTEEEKGFQLLSEGQ